MNIWFSRHTKLMLVSLVIGMLLLVVFKQKILATPSNTTATQEHHKHSGHSSSDGKDPHAAHRAAMSSNKYSLYKVSYDLPSIDLVTSQGESFSIASLDQSEQPIALNFIFTTCTTICPVMTATFSQMRKQLGDSAKNLRMISITIDPEYDRPEKLKVYSENFNQGYDWLFLTGDSRDVFEVIKGFKAYNGSKMNHKPLTLLRKPGDKQWVRVEGLVSSGTLTQLVKDQLLH